MPYTTILDLTASDDEEPIELAKNFSKKQPDRSTAVLAAALTRAGRQTCVPEPPRQSMPVLFAGTWEQRRSSRDLALVFFLSEPCLQSLIIVGEPSVNMCLSPQNQRGALRPYSTFRIQGQTDGTRQQYGSAFGAGRFPTQQFHHLIYSPCSLSCLFLAKHKCAF